MEKATGIYNEATLNIENCKIVVSADTSWAVGIFNFNTGIATISNCDIFADAPGVMSNDEGISAIGIVNNGELTFNSGDVVGTQLGLRAQADAKTYVHGGTFSSCYKGGMGFYHGNAGEAYIENTTITCSEYTGQYSDFKGKNEMLAGLFVGGMGSKASNNTVYMNNCNVSGGIIISGDNGATGNKLYISNSKVSGNAQVDAKQELHIGINTSLTTTGDGTVINEQGVSYKRSK